jgi:hypothetical protein
MSIDVCSGMKELSSFLRASFKSSGCSLFGIDLAFLSCLYYFKCLTALSILQKEVRALMFYEPDTPWLIVLSINHILGRVALMKAYLEGSDSPTIPSSFKLTQHKLTSAMDTLIALVGGVEGAVCLC